MAKLGMHHPILWLYQPEQVRTIGRYGEKLVVYHVVDEYTAYAGIPVDYRKLMMAYEQHLLRQADVVIVTAPALQETRASLARHLYVVPNAVDYDAFQAILSSRRSPTIPLPSTRPLLGYVGAINDKLDYDLLAAVAIARPEWTLLMVGMQDVRVPEDREGLHRLVALPNVRLLGPVPVHEVPLVMAACDVCLLPYKRNQRTRAISSLKLYEYLACGRPVVATDIPAAHEAGDVVTIAQDLPSFIAGIARALQDAPGAAEARRHVAAQNTWQQRMEQISAILLSVLSQRGG
jgi:glycosyltransferase involved in cell wall biosynthesis